MVIMNKSQNAAAKLRIICSSQQTSGKGLVAFCLEIDFYVKRESWPKRNLSRSGNMCRFRNRATKNPPHEGELPMGAKPSPISRQRLTLLQMLHFALLYRGAGKSCGGQNRGAAKSRGAYRLLADKSLMHKTAQKCRIAQK